MELKLVPNPKNLYPFGGILIKNTSPTVWFNEVQRMGFSLSDITLYPVPDVTANSVWGCFVAFAKKLDAHTIGQNEVCLMVANNVYIPEKTMLHPSLTTYDIQQLFTGSMHIFHQDFGFVDLGNPLDLSDLLQKPEEKSVYIRKPKPAFFVPNNVKSIQISPVSAEDVMEEMESKLFPQQNPRAEAPLSMAEKLKLQFYKTLFSKGQKSENGEGIKGDSNSYRDINESDGFLSKMAAKIQHFFDKDNKIGSKMKQDLEDLERRNQKQLDNLLDLFKKDLDEALKYAIPLDKDGTSRGTSDSEFSFSKINNLFSWLSDTGMVNVRSGSTMLSSDHFMTLMQQYNESAELLKRKNDYQKAAFVYLKLLKNPEKAAQTLEEGKFYKEAATIYLKHLQNPIKAANSYEKGNFNLNAIELYKEIGDDEKVGDLYQKIGKPTEANVYFEKKIEQYQKQNQYLFASQIYKQKMNKPENGQAMLLKGWRNKHDAFNCLNNYFVNIEDMKTLKNEINKIYKTDVDDSNREIFLDAIQHEYTKHEELAEDLKEMAYEIIAQQSTKKPDILTKLRDFNKKDDKLNKDVMFHRFKK